MYPTLMKEMGYGILDLTQEGYDGVVKRKYIPIYPKKLPLVQLKGYILKNDQIEKKVPGDSRCPNRFWIEFIPLNSLTDKLKIYTLVYDEYLESFNNQAKVGNLVCILNLEREVKDPKRQFFNTFIYRERSFKVLDGNIDDLNLNFYQKNAMTIRKRIKSSKYLRQTKALRLECLNPYTMIRHCVKIKCKFIKIAYLKIVRERNLNGMPDQATFRCQVRLVASSSNRGTSFNGQIGDGETYFYIQIFDDLNLLTNLFGFDSLQKDKMIEVLREYGDFRYYRRPQNGYGRERKWLNSLFNNTPNDAYVYGYFHLDEPSKSKFQFFAHFNLIQTINSIKMKKCS